MIDAKEAVVWTNNETREIRVLAKGSHRHDPQLRAWSDPIGASYDQWRQMDSRDRVQLMIETAIDLTMQGFDLGSILREFAKVQEFRALGSESIPMCRALTSALVGKCLEPNTMSFEELLEQHRNR